MTPRGLRVVGEEDDVLHFADRRPHGTPCPDLKPVAGAGRGSTMEF